jgi:hypothetical protein
MIRYATRRGMTRISPAYMQRLPATVPKAEWRNITGQWLKLKLPGTAEEVHVVPGCPMQIRVADLARAPDVAVWLAWLERRGLLARIEDRQQRPRDADLGSETPNAGR